MTVASSLEPIRVSLETRADIQITHCQGFVGTTMIEAILVTLKTALISLEPFVTIRTSSLLSHRQARNRAGR